MFSLLNTIGTVKYKTPLTINIRETPKNLQAWPLLQLHLNWFECPEWAKEVHKHWVMYTMSFWVTNKLEKCLSYLWHICSLSTQPSGLMSLAVISSATLNLLKRSFVTRLLKYNTFTSVAKKRKNILKTYLSAQMVPTNTKNQYHV